MSSLSCPAAVHASTGAGFLCAPETCCKNVIATYDQFPAGCDVKSYGNLTYKNFVVGDQYDDAGVEITTPPNFALGKAACDDKGKEHLPEFSFDVKDGYGLRFQNFTFACVTPEGTHATACDLTLIGDENAQYTARYDPTVGSDGKAIMDTLAVGKPLDETNNMNYKLNATGKDGKRLDVFIDNFNYQLVLPVSDCPEI